MDNQLKVHISFTPKETIGIWKTIILEESVGS
jgi:hypothetical protein